MFVLESLARAFYNIFSEICFHESIPNSLNHKLEPRLFDLGVKLCIFIQFSEPLLHPRASLYTDTAKSNPPKTYLRKILHESLIRQTEQQYPFPVTTTPSYAGRDTRPIMMSPRLRLHRRLFDSHWYPPRQGYIKSNL